MNLDSRIENRDPTMPLDPLEPLDIVLATWAALRRGESWQQAEAARVLGVAPSMISYASRRLRAADVLTAQGQVRSQALDAILPAIRWIYPSSRDNQVGRGKPTAHAAPDLELGIRGPPFVWDVPPRGGTIPPTEWVQGTLVDPIHPCVPAASARDPRLYQAMAAIDATRVGDPRLRKAGERAARHLLGLGGPET